MGPLMSMLWPQNGEAGSYAACAEPPAHCPCRFPLGTAWAAGSACRLPWRCNCPVWHTACTTADHSSLEANGSGAQISLLPERRGRPTRGSGGAHYKQKQKLGPCKDCESSRSLAIPLLALICNENRTIAWCLSGGAPSDGPRPSRGPGEASISSHLPAARVVFAGVVRVGSGKSPWRWPRVAYGPSGAGLHTPGAFQPGVG